MAWKTARYQLISDAPLLMHSSRTVNPLDPLTKRLKSLSSKKKKTDADYTEIAKTEFMAGIYMGSDGPAIPAVNIEAMLENAARRRRESPLVRSGVFCSSHARLEYDGPRDMEQLWADQRFRRMVSARVGNARVMRTRPNFDTWQAIIEVQYEDTLVNLEQLDAWFHIGGTQIGIGDWRPKHGRFTAKRLPN